MSQMVKAAVRGQSNDELFVVGIVVFSDVAKGKGAGTKIPHTVYLLERVCPLRRKQAGIKTTGSQC